MALLLHIYSNSASKVNLS